MPLCYLTTLGSVQRVQVNFPPPMKVRQGWHFAGDGSLCTDHCLRRVGSRHFCNTVPRDMTNAFTNEITARWKHCEGALCCSWALAAVSSWVSKWSISWLLQQEELSHNRIQWQEQKSNSLRNSLWNLYIPNRRTQYGGFFFLIKVCKCCLHVLGASDFENKFYLWKLLFIYL